MLLMAIKSNQSMGLTPDLLINPLNEVGAVDLVVIVPGTVGQPHSLEWELTCCEPQYAGWSTLIQLIGIGAEADLYRSDIDHKY